MANYNNWYNPALEKLRNDTEKRAYQKRMQILEENKRNQSIRTVFDIFLNKKARERVGGDNWFETTFKSVGQFFDNNFIEWFRNPANALMNNLSSIGDTLDYAANLIKAPMIAAAKGEDVGERLADAYGLGDKGRIAQNMSDLREVLGAEDPSAEIGVSAGMGAITGAEIGTKVAPGIGTLIGGLIGAGIGTINSSIDAAVRESGTDNAFWKGTQTVGNTITDMMMEYGVDPANFAGAIGDAFKATKAGQLTTEISSKTLDDIAKQELDTTESFVKSLNGEQAYKARDILDHVYKSTAENVTKPRFDKAGKEIVTTAEQQRKQFNKKINGLLKSYMDNDKKNFDRYLIDTGIGKYLSDDPDILNKQINDIFSTLRHDANMSKVGRIAAFIDRFDSGFAKKLYKGTVPGLTLTSAKKAFVKMHNEWEQGLLKTAQMYGKDIIKKDLDLNIVERAARQHYFNKFKKAGIQFEIPEGATPQKINAIYRSMSNGMAIYYANGKRREYQVLKGLRKGITLDNGIKSVNLGKAESNFKKIIRYFNGDATVTSVDFDKAIDELTDLFYFKNGIDFFQSMLFDPTYFKGDFGQVEKMAEAVISKAIAIVEDDPIRRYAKTIDSIIDKTTNFDNYRIAVENFYNNELHQTIENILGALHNKENKLELAQRSELYKALYNLMTTGSIDKNEINLISQMLRDNSFHMEDTELYNKLFSIYSKELGLDPTNYNVRTYINILAVDNMQASANGFEKSLSEYIERNKLIAEGNQLRANFNAYKNAINGTKEALATTKISDDVRMKDIGLLDKLQSKQIVDIYMEAFRKELNKQGLNPEDIEKISKAAADDFARIINDLDSSDISTYDVMLHFNNILSVGSTRLNNFIKYSQINNTKSFLDTFKVGVARSRKIANDKNLKGHSRMITNKLNKLNTEIDKSDFAINSAMIYPLLTDNNQAKLFTNAVTDFIFGNRELPENVINMLKNMDGHHVLDNNTELIAKSEDLINSLYDLEKNNDLELIRYLYNKTSGSFGNRKFNRGNNPLDAIHSVINTLKFVTEKDYSNLNNGVFVDNLIQQTLYETAVKEINQTVADNLDVVIDKKTAKNIFKEVFKELNVTGEVKRTIDNTLTELYAKRNKLISRLSELETEKINKSDNVIEKIEKGQASLINSFKHHTDSLYNKLNVITASMFTTNMENAEFNLKAGKDFAGLVNNLDTLSKAKVTNAQLESMKKILATKINEKMLKSDSFKGVLRFISGKDDVDNIAIRNGVIHITKGNNTTKITSKDLKDFFNNIGGIYKADFIRTGTGSNIKINNISIESSINGIKQTTKALQHWYIRYFNSLVNNDEVIFKDRDVQDFVKIFKEYTTEMNDIENKLLTKNESTIKEVARLKYNEVKATNFAARYVDNFRNNTANNDMLVKTRSKLYEEPFFSRVYIEADGRRIVEEVSLNELFNNDRQWFDSKFKLPLIDTETSLDAGLATNKTGYENINKDLYQYTIRTNATDKAQNILILHPELTNDYKFTNEDLLDANFVNGKFTEIGGIKLDDKGTYVTFEKDGIQYALYRDPLEAAKVIFNDLLSRGALTPVNLMGQNIGYELSFIGHNAANFDAEIIMNFINKHMPNTIRHANVVDTMWLARAVMAADGIFKDDHSTKLGNLFKHWFPKEADIVEGAHNADVDTYMNYKILEYIKSRLGNNPAEFFKRTFSTGGQAFIDDNKDMFNELNSIFKDKYFEEIYGISTSKDSFFSNAKRITFEDMLTAEELSKAHELRTSVNDDYIKQIYDNMQKDLIDLEEAFDNIDSIDSLEKFIDVYDDFSYTYYKYLNYNLNTLEDSKVHDLYDKLIAKYDDRMTALYGDSRYMVRLNREYALDYALDGYSLVANDNSVTNAFQEIMAMLSVDSIDKLGKAKPNSVVGEVLYNLLNYYNYDKEALFNDFMGVKEFYNYTNRINAHIKFRQSINNIIDRYADDDNYEEVKQAQQTLMTALTGYGEGDRASIDNMLTAFIKNANRTNRDSLRAIPELKAHLKEHIAGKLIKLFSDDIYNNIKPDDIKELTDTVNNYINDCIDNIDSYNILTDVTTRTGGSFTILRPANDRHYVNLMMSAFGTHNDGLLGKYQSIINKIKAKDIMESNRAQDFDKNGFDYVINSFRDRLRYIRDTDRELNKTKLPLGYIETANDRSVWQMNGAGYMYTFKSANKYNADWDTINKSKNAIYKSFGIKYDPNLATASTYRDVESRFHLLVKRIQADWGLTYRDIQRSSEISALEDPIYDVEKQVFIDYFDNYVTEDNEFYKELRSNIMSYKSRDINAIDDLEKRMIEEKNIENSVKAFIGSAYIQGNFDDSPFLTYKTMNRLTRQQKLLQYASRYIDESTKTMNDIFTDVKGNINYALMYKYLQSNPTLKVAVLIPSDRFNNMERSRYQMSGEFITLDAKDAFDLEGMLTHDPQDGIRYFIIDKNNLMQLKKSIGQATSKKTYTNRQLFENHPAIEKMMNLRDIIAKYVLMPVKVLGLQNLGFTVTNAAEAFLKTMTATTGNRIETLKQYHKAISMHRKWSQATGEIAKAIQGSPFYLGKNQWNAMIQELGNSNALFKNTDIKTIKQLLASNSIKDIKSVLPSVTEFSNTIANLEDIPQYAKLELSKKYAKMFTKKEHEQLDAIRRLAERYVRVNEAYESITKTFNKDEFDFVAEFVNSPAAAAEMQSIKKANELNLIGNKSRLKNGKVDKIDNPLDRFYKKALFSDWGIDEYNPFRVITPYFNLSLNSDIETINRLALHMDLLDKGFTKSESYNRVLQSFFNYGDKSEPELLAELFFPFISFPFRTTLFWDEMLEEHPQLIEIFADLVLTNWGKDAQNQYNQTGITKGGLKITPNLSVESGMSFLDSLSFGGNALNVLGSRKLNPLLGPLVEGAKQLTTGEANWDYRLSRMPLIGKVMYGQDLVNNLQKGQPHLYDIAPSIFNKVYEQNRYYYRNQGQYAYRSTYSRLYYASGGNRWNSRNRSKAVNMLVKK